MLLGVWDGYLSPQEEALSSVSKLGGKPVFMPPNAAAIENAVRPLATCGVCGDPMFLLLQCYCPLPIDANEEYNRMKYVFCCNNATCCRQPEKSWISISVTSSTFDEAAEKGEGDVAEDEDEVEEMPSALAPFTFPAAGIDVIDEPDKAVVKLDDHELHMLAQYERRQLLQKKIAEMRARGEEPDEQELLEAGLTQEDAEAMEKEIDLKNRSSDVAYDRFRRRVERCPKQVIRYEYKGTPLFMNPSRLSDVKVPACGRCGGPQAMELQIMPTVIFLLKTSEYVKDGGASSASSAAPLTAAAASAEVSVEVKEAVRAAGEGVDFASVTCYHCANPKCGSDVASLFELPAEGSSPSVLTTKGFVGGGAENIKFNIRKEFLLVEAAPELEEDMGLQSGNTAASTDGAVGPLAPRPKTLREIMFAPMPTDEDADEEEESPKTDDA